MYRKFKAITTNYTVSRAVQIYLGCLCHLFFVVFQCLFFLNLCLGSFLLCCFLLSYLFFFSFNLRYLLGVFKQFWFCLKIPHKNDIWYLFFQHFLAFVWVNQTALLCWVHKYTKILHRPLLNRHFCRSYWYTHAYCFLSTYTTVTQLILSKIIILRTPILQIFCVYFQTRTDSFC